MVKKLNEVHHSQPRKTRTTYIKPVAGEPLHAVVDGEDVNPLAVLHVWAALDGHHVPEPHTEVVPHHAVHPDLLVPHGVVRQHDADALLPLLPLQKDSVAPEQLELVHLGHGESNHGVVVIDGILHNQSVGPLLLVENSRGELVPRGMGGSLSLS